jgi:site-specific recombinase XerD
MKTTRTATTEQPEWPPRGLAFETREGKSLPFYARWRDQGRRATKAFESEKKRDEFATAWLKARSERIKSSVTVVDREMWAEFTKLTDGVDPLAVARYWADGHAPTLLGDAVARFLAAQAGRKLSRDTESHRDLHLARCVAALGSSAVVTTIKPDTIRAWLDGLKVDGRQASPDSRRHHRANVRKLWRWLCGEGLAKTNPVDAVPIPEDDSDDITLLTLAQAKKLFEVNAGHISIGRLALEAFGGLRTSSAARLKAEDIKREEKGIVLPGPKHKSGRRHYIDGLPANLWAWIDHAPEACWQVHPRAYTDHKRRMMLAAGMKGDGVDDEETRNALRHSFASYHVAAYKDAGKTAVLLTHRTPTLLYQFYKGRATEADGLAYFGIVPT